MINKFKYIFPTIFLLFFLPILILNILEIPKSQLKAEIAQNGTSVQATVTNIVNIADSDETPEYIIKFTFNLNGTTYTGKTSTTYSTSKANEYNSTGKIEVKYQVIDNNVVFVESDYTYKVSNSVTTIIILSVFVVVGCFLLIKFIIKDVNLLKVKKHGTISEATFVSCAVGGKVNNSARYFIEYSFNGENNQRIIEKSPTVYTTEEAFYYKNRNTFEIKTLKNNSVITEKPFTHKVEDVTNLVNELKHLSPVYVCEYCNFETHERKKKCSNCGANLKLKKK